MKRRFEEQNDMQINDHVAAVVIGTAK